MIVVAVKHLDVDPGIRHPSRELAELPGDGLLQALNHDIAILQHLDPGPFQRRPRRHAVGEQEMRAAHSADHPRAATFDAHTGATECFTHAGQLTRAVVELDGEVFHDEVLADALRREG